MVYILARIANRFHITIVKILSYVSDPPNIIMKKEKLSFRLKNLNIKFYMVVGSRKRLKS